MKFTKHEIKIIDDMILNCRYKHNYYDKYSEDKAKVLEKIKKLQKENEELRNKLSLKQFDINVVYNDYLEKLNEYKENSIPIQKIKDKIEELNQYYKKEIYPILYQWSDITITEHYDEMIGLLQELLGDK